MEAQNSISTPGGLAADFPDKLTAWRSGFGQAEAGCPRAAVVEATEIDQFPQVGPKFAARSGLKLNRRRWCARFYEDQYETASHDLGRGRYGCGCDRV